MTNAQNIENNEIKTLTRTEKKILGLISENKTSPEIAEELFVSVRTIQNHRYNISRKLGLKGPNKLLEFAIKNRVLINELPAGNLHGPVRNLKTNKQLISRILLPGFLAAALLILTVIFLPVRLENSVLLSGNMEPGHIRLAVLPMRTSGSDSIASWVSEGLTEELIIQLSGIPGMRVIAYGSVSAYNSRQKDIGEIAEELNVQIIIDGSMRKIDSLIRINLQLIDVPSGENIWASGYDVTPLQYARSQNEVAMKIARALELEVFLENLSGEPPGGPDVIAAEENLLKGRFYINRGTAHGFQRAENFFLDAIAADSSYARAWAELANLYTWKSNYGIMAPDSAYSLARSAAEKAIALNPVIGEAHRSRAAVALLYDWDFQLAESELKRAISMNPSDVMAYRLISLLYLAQGKPSEAIQHSETALELDPLSVMNNALYGRTLYFARAYERSEEQLRKTLDMEPGFWLANTYKAEVLLEQNNHEAAIRHLESTVKQKPGNIVALSRLGHGYARSGEKEKAHDIIRSLQDERQLENALHFQVALIYTALGDHDSAFYYLERAYEKRHDYMLDLRSDPKLDVLRNDKRFKKLLDQMGL